MKKFASLVALSALLVGCGDEAAEEAPQETETEDVAQEEKDAAQEQRNEELSAAMMEKFKETHAGEAIEEEVDEIIVWEDLGVIRVKSSQLAEDRYELTANTIGSVWYEHFREEFVPKTIELWVDG